MSTPAPAPDFSLAELAHRFGLELRGDGDVRIGGVATLAGAGPGELGFLANPRYRRELPRTRAAAVVLAAGDADASPAPCLVSASPYAAFAKIAALFEAVAAPDPGIHPSAVVAADASVDPDAQIGPFTTIGARARIDAGAVIGPGVAIGEDCVVGPGCVLGARVVLVERVRLGARVRIHPGAVLGADGFGLAMDDGHWIKVPQRGGVAVAGSSRIGRYCLVGGGAGIVGHVELCDRVIVTAMSLVTRSITEPGEYSSALPAQEARSWRRTGARLRRLDELARKIDALAKDPG